MAGIYLHIPFCREACRYCDFFFSVALDKKDAVVEAILREVSNRKDFLGNESVHSIYFGGGTPSVLAISEIKQILQCLGENFHVHKDAEITLEANPDDLNKTYLTDLRHAGINRLSIGVQSWDNNDLQLMHRLHNANQASACIYSAVDAGFHNLNADLIYGLPGMDSDKWESHLKVLFEHPITHLSAYHLTYEKGTAFYHDLQKGRIRPIDEEESIKQYEMLLKLTAEAGLQQYEISNFAREGYISKHNHGYWTGMHYLGLGPSAHSYNGDSRFWNAANIKKYMQGVMQHQPYYESETLESKDRYNEYLLTSLRTVQGLDLEAMEARFGKTQSARFITNANVYIEDGKMMREGKRLYLSAKGMVLADGIISDLFEVSVF